MGQAPVSKFEVEEDMPSLYPPTQKASDLKKKRRKRKKSKSKGEEPEDMSDEEAGGSDFSAVRASLLDVGRKKLEEQVGPGATGDVTSPYERIKVKTSQFVVKSRDVVDPSTGKIVNRVSFCTVRDQSITNVLAGYDVHVTGQEKEVGLFGGVTYYQIYAVESLLMRLPMLKTNNFGGLNNKVFAEWLEAEYQEAVDKIEAHLDKGQISFDGLWYIFERGNRFFTSIGKNQVIGSEVKHMRYSQTLFGSTFDVTGEVVKSDGTRFYTEDKVYSISNFKGVVDLDALNVKPMTTAVLEQLTQRGRLFQKIALGHHYLHYERFIFYKHSQFRINYTKADGRVMVDISTFNRMNPTYTEFGASAHVDPYAAQQFNIQNQLYNAGNPYAYQQQQMRNPAYAQQQQQHQQRNQNMELSEDILYKTWPTVAGFSFAAKAWGEIIVSNLSDIQFDDHAYDNLVLPMEKKTLIKALVEDNKVAQQDASNTFTDIISGKGGGVIFLLHGPPGVGKTLTAEAIAELLHRPLYSVSVGELGTTAETLEQKLQDILELASIWNSVVLIDEADIFLEARTEHDVVRNAMVGIFLRKLEYHQGVLFLTTNRVRCFDPAFNSRVSVAIKYNALDAIARGQVWKNLLAVASAATHTETPESDFEDLGSYDLNGRQIRTTIRLALALARSEDVPVSNDHVKRTVSIAHQFEAELQREEATDATNLKNLTALHM